MTARSARVLNGSTRFVITFVRRFLLEESLIPGICEYLIVIILLAVREVYGDGEIHETLHGLWAHLVKYLPRVDVQFLQSS